MQNLLQELAAAFLTSFSLRLWQAFEREPTGSSVAVKQVSPFCTGRRFSEPGGLRRGALI